MLYSLNVHVIVFCFLDFLSIKSYFYFIQTFFDRLLDNMLDSPESEETSSCELDSEPQEKFWVLSKLPFDVSEQMEQMLSVIKKTLVRSSQQTSFGLEIRAATEKLHW